MSRTQFIVSLFAMGIIVATATATAPVPSARAAPLQTTIPTTDAALSVHDHRIWIQSLDGGRPVSVPLPWSVQLQAYNPPYLQWSPDGRKVATDNAQDRIAVIDLQTRRRVLIPARIDRCVDGYRWSPDSRYLAFLRAGSKSALDCGKTDDLWVWNAATGRVRRLVRNAGGPNGTPPMWSHDSTRIAIAVGSTSFPGPPTWDVGTQLVSVTVNGRVTRYGLGSYAVWSPDDRFLAYLHLYECGNACVADERVVPASGGRSITLARGEERGLTDPQWAKSPSGYAFDRWILNRAGRPLRTLVSPPLRVDAWSGDGRYALATRYYEHGCCNPAHGNEELISGLTGAKTTAVPIHLAPNTEPPYIPWAYGGAHALALVLEPYAPWRKTTNPLFLVTWAHGRPLISLTTVPVGIPVGLIHDDRDWLSWSQHHFTIFDLATHRSRSINVRVGRQDSPVLYVKIASGPPVRVP